LTGAEVDDNEELVLLSTWANDIYQHWQPKASCSKFAYYQMIEDTNQVTLKIDNIYQFEKVLYELKQAPKVWYEKLSIFLTDHIDT